MKSCYNTIMPIRLPTITAAEEDAYAHLVAVANDHATDADRRKLVRAGLLPDPANPNADADDSRRRKPSPAVPSVVAGMRDAAIRYLLARANGVRFQPALAAAGEGVEWIDIQRYRWANPQYAVVMDFVARSRADILAAKATDALESLIDGDGASDARNAKAVQFALERLRRDQYADPRNADHGGKGGKGGNGGGVVYNITFQGAPQPNLCGVCVGNSPNQPIIDIKSE